MSKRINKYPNSKKTKERLKAGIKGIIPTDGYSIASYEMFAGRVKSPKMKKGMSTSDLAMFKNSRPDLERLYSQFFFTLLEKMVFDFINGDVIIYDKKRNLKLFRWDRITGQKGIKRYLDKKMINIPSFDIRKTGYTIPTIMMELGYKNKPGAILLIPKYLYIVFLDSVYKGKNHIKSSKHMATPEDFWNRNRQDAIDNKREHLYYNKKK